MFVFLHEFFENKEKKFYISEDYESYSSINKTSIEYQSINKLIDDYFSYNIEKHIVSNLKLNLKTKLNKDLKKFNNIKENQEKILAKQNKINLYMTKGNLLIANAYLIKNREKQITLKDYETNKDVIIELDETKTPIENAQRYFALYNKGKKAIQIAEDMSKQTMQEIDYLNQIIFDIEICNKIKELEEIAQEFLPQNEINKKNKQNTINVEKREIDNLIIYIGKNNKQNDYLYSKISSPEDLWFHVLNTPSAHIIAKKENSNDKIADTTILKIAQLAKEFSTAKNSTKVPVVYTQRKYIKRPQNTKSGFVVYKNEKEIVVT
jgi:predicted ribosome quality control (RQC) complex YloA/Tae2 family protein